MLCNVVPPIGDGLETVFVLALASLLEGWTMRSDNAQHQEGSVEVKDQYSVICEYYGEVIRLQQQLFAFPDRDWQLGIDPQLDSSDGRILGVLGAPG